MVPTFELGSREPGSGGLYVGAVHAACHMARSEELSRLSIVQAMTDALEPLSFVQAFYEGGAAAFHRIDVWSDIDLYIVVDDAMVPKTFRVVEKVLASLSPIRLIHEESWPAASGIFQKFYRLEKAGEFLLVDLAVLTVSAPDKFLVREIHGEVVFLFNKRDSIQIPPLDREAFVRGLLDHRRRLRERMELFGPFVEKELLRGHRLEALEFYRALVVPSLVGALRMRYGPLHYDFRMRYVYRELPPDVVRRLEGLTFVTDTKDLATKYREARAWFDKAIEEVDESQIRRDVAGISK